MTIESDKGTVCEGCRHFYNLNFDLSGWHNICAEGNCYLCADRDGECSEYEAGDVPEGETRGAWAW